MMPVQRMRGAFFEDASVEDISVKDISVEDMATILDEAANEVVGDGDRRRRGQAIGMAPVEHQRELLALEPARVLDLAAIDDDLVRARLGMAADHQRARKRPRLRREIDDV